MATPQVNVIKLNRAYQEAREAHSKISEELGALAHKRPVTDGSVLRMEDLASRLSDVVRPYLGPGMV